ncbi:hypothetical protein AVEN_103761-1 [Araneus ventricosus]|uniref:Nuclear cap-binding protein subunit 3 n=1 Tax=Araneus ventricosus TaxID=182803 RepID=A0A4Y2PDK5_ARAVE|nr:hypothetical protein AVEN_103761-1 [Araneus ventricosus]
MLSADPFHPLMVSKGALREKLSPLCLLLASHGQPNTPLVGRAWQPIRWVVHCDPQCINSAGILTTCTKVSTEAGNVQSRWLPSLVGLLGGWCRRDPNHHENLHESLAKEDEVKSSEAEDIIEMTDSEEGDYNDKKELNEVVENSMEVDSLSDTEKPDDLETKNDSSKVPAEVVDVPVPPGHWRLGVSHPKSKAILLRFATKDDKKLPGAEKRSQYYQKYGNPNYGGLKGLISSSRKRKMQAARNRQVVEKFTEDSTSQSEINSGETSKRTVIKANRSKMPRMRMYADDEEEKNRKSSFMHYKSGRRSVHSRLGTKYTKDDLFQLGNRFSSESEEEDDNISINCTVPSRFNIWTDIAKSMAKEDNYRARSNSPDSEPFDLRKSRNNRAARDRSFARDRRSPESTRGSRPWRPSRDDSSQDLRSSLNSHRRQRPLNKPQEDLRSKIKRIKKEDTVNKHRSPMFMDD